MKYTSGQIVVVTKNVRAGCGVIKLHKGSIVKICNPEPDNDGDITIYRNFNREKMKHLFFVNPKYLRTAESKEVKAYYNNVKNISFIKD